MVSDRGFLATQDQNDGYRLCLGSVGAGGLSVTQAGSYGPAVVAVIVVVLIGGLVQLLIPPATRASTEPGRP